MTKTHDEIIEAAARILSPNCMWDEGYVNAHQERRREIARTKARAVTGIFMEACAKKAEDFPAETHGSLSTNPVEAARQTANEIAAAIRALASPVKEG
jgi:hypothetical protein